jgi:hypothetical protein
VRAQRLVEREASQMDHNLGKLTSAGLRVVAILMALVGVLAFTIGVAVAVSATG